MGRQHTHSLRIYIEDTDAGGIVYYANYLKFAERARTEFMRSLGWENAAMMRGEGNKFVVRTCSLNCLTPAYLDDRVEVRTRCLARGGATLTLAQHIYRGETLLATLDVLLAYVNGEGRPIRIDKGLLAALDAFEADIKEIP